MNKQTFDKFRKLVYQKSGISLTEKKIALVRSRITKRLRALDINDFEEYLSYVKSDRSGGEIVNLLDVISTNVTSFFREADHFNVMKEAIEGWIAEGQKKFRFWSAACSTGEEPYTMAMIINETIKDPKADVKILATDISTQVLGKCREGKYSEEKVKPVSSVLRNRYLTKEGNGKESLYKVKDILKNQITFTRINLSNPPFPMHGPFDMVFCRNVMIYFDNDVRMKLINEINRLLKPGGYLMVGHSESLSRLNIGFKFKCPSVYIKSKTLTHVLAH
ncbi:protein-glutamate O-methyltransferase CheR [bacterium]|nr:protein-glutamate O-methyltransferase CheR [bacterium]